MRHLSLFIIALLSCVNISAQTDWAKDAAKAVFTLKTFAADGSLLSSTNGFFISDDGTAITTFTPFIGASRAVAFNAKGKEMTVECLLGANETYDVARVRIQGKDYSALSVADDSLTTDVPLWMLPYSAGKKPVCERATINKIEKFADSYDYLTLLVKASELTVGSPLLNEQGEVVAIMQSYTANAEGKAYAVSARYAADQKIQGLSLNDETFAKTAIKIGIPEDKNQALLTLFMAEQSKDSASYAAIVNDFIAAHPNVADGYIARARLNVNGHNFDAAADDMEHAIDVAEKKDDAHYNYSRLIAGKLFEMPDAPYAPWTFDLAAEHADKAYDINPVALYRQLKAQIRFGEKRYAEAYDIYHSMTEQGNRTPEIFYEAAQCKQLLGDTIATIALLDSCVATFNKPYLKAAAPYLYERAKVLLAAKEYRRAVLDFNEFEKLLPTELNANFYYTRAQAEISGRLYQQAVNDMKKAVSLEPNSAFYLVEKASLEMRLGLHDDAIQTATECIAVDPSTSEAYIFLGLAQCMKGNKAEGRQNLEKARDMGNTQAQSLIDKYAQ